MKLFIGCSSSNNIPAEYFEDCKILEDVNNFDNGGSILNQKNSEIIEDSDYIIKTKDLKLYNGYGGFNEDGSEYYIIQGKNNRLPLAWSNILANKNFGSVVTDSLRRIYMV